MPYCDKCHRFECICWRKVNWGRVVVSGATWAVALMILITTILIYVDGK